MTEVIDIEKGERRAPRIAVCVPSHEQVSAYTMYDLSRMLMATAAGPLADGSIDALGLNLLPGTYVHRAREILAETALQGDSDYILWVDADMRFPKDALVRLLMHNKDMVGINYSKRGLPAEFVAVKEIDWESDEESRKCFTNADSTGLEKVEAIGFGLVLMRAHIFKRLASEKPWFWYEMKPFGHVGEDVYFCRKVNEAGFDIHVDHDLSKECSHIGSLEYKPVHAQDAVDSGFVAESGLAKAR